jgi:hypothetical protein
MAWWHPEIRPGERRNALGAFLILFGAMAGHSLLVEAMARRVIDIRRESAARG